TVCVGSACGESPRLRRGRNHSAADRTAEPAAMAFMCGRAYGGRRSADGPVGGSLFEEDHAMPRTVAQKLIAAHLVEGELEPGAEIGLRVDQTLTQDATGTMVMLELEAMGLDRIRTELSVQYVDHNLLQTDEKNPDDHLFLKSAAERFGLWFSKAGNGVSHPVHQADEGASYDHTERIDLSSLEPLIAAPSSPGNVVPVAEAAGQDVTQVVIGSSANPGLRDFAVVAEILDGRQADGRVSVVITLTSREGLADLTTGGWLASLVGAGACIPQSGCVGCIGMGQAPASGRNSLRTMPRNFPGRSGTEEDSVWLCS